MTFCRSFQGHKTHMLAHFLQKEMTDFPTLLYTSMSEIPTLSYT